MVLAGVMLANCQGNETGAGAGGKTGGAEDSGGEQSTGGKPGSGGLPGAGGMSGDGGRASGGGGGAGGVGSGGDVTGGGQGSGGLPGSGGMPGDGGKGSGGRGGAGGVGSGGGATDAGRAGARAGGSTGRGGSGQADSGGQAGGGGQAGSGGQAGGGGRGGGAGGGDTGNGGSTASGSCAFTQSSKVSDKIKTVGIVTWSTNLEGLESAKIDFGLDTNYGMTAPVENPVSGENTTLLLGMKPTVSSSSPRVYHYRITATGSSGECVSPDYTIQTGALLNGLPKITVSNKSTSSPVYGGFLITGQFVQMASGSGSPAYIVDKDGEMVWAVVGTRDVTGVRMSYDGKSVWINCVNVATSGSGNTACVHRVSMDGQKDEDLSSKFTGLNHQLTVLPDETVAFYAYASNGCDDIKEYDPSTGKVKTVVNSGKATNSSVCHCNFIQYSKDDDTLVFSELDSQTIVKVKRSDGSVVWRLNGGSPTISGVSWKGGNHGIHLLGLDDLLVFNNNSRMSMGGGGSAGGDASGSVALEIKLNLSAKTASQPWSYKANPGIQVDIMGDLQRMPNGNTIIAYSTKGVLHEVDKNGTLLQEWTWPSGSSFGYIEKRATLYGPPPK